MKFTGDSKNLIYFSLLFVIFIVGSHSSVAQNTLAFPGAEGFGKYSQGGRGGEVIKVTNLNDSGPGSLRAALEAEGPRIVVFEVGGLINLETSIHITNPYITIAGQTAPGDGITVRGNGIIIRTHNVVMRFLRIRPGDRSFGPENNWVSLDAVTIGGRMRRSDVHDVIIDHCSLSWAVDEVLSITNNTYNITVQNSIISEGLSYSKHPENEHSKGLLVYSETSDPDSVSILNNLIMHNTGRNPLVNTTGLVDVRNNVIYDPGIDGAVFINNSHIRTQEANFVNNILKEGPSTRTTKEISVFEPDIYNGLIFIENNSGFEEDREENNWLMLKRMGTKEPLTSDIYTSFKSDREFPNKDVNNKDKSEIIGFVNEYIGASLPVRDGVDKRLVEEYKNREGSIIDSQDEVGGWPAHLNASPPKDTQNNGIPDYWMERYGMQPGEENGDFDNDDYTNIEEYLNGTDPNNSNNRKGDIFSSNSSIASLQQLNFEIEQNYPNPFQSETIIRMQLPDGKSQVYIYDSIGRKIEKILDRDLSMGEYELVWEPDRSLSSGTYFLKIIHEGRSQYLPMTYIK